MATSAIPGTLRYLVNTFRAAATLGAAADPVRVFFAREVSDEFAKLALWVGMDDPDVDIPTAATSTQAWVGMPARAVDELFDVFLVAEAWSGDTDPGAAMDAAYGIVAAVENLTRADANLGGNVLFIRSPTTGHTLRLNNTDKGAVAQVQFLISCKARIGS